MTFLYSSDPRRIKYATFIPIYHYLAHSLHISSFASYFTIIPSSLASPSSLYPGKSLYILNIPNTSDAMIPAIPSTASSQYLFLFQRCLPIGSFARREPRVNSIGCRLILMIIAGILNSLFIPVPPIFNPR